MHSAFCIASARTGREFDNLTGLHYYRARRYDASVGRFISEDPIGFAGGDVNLYGYVGNTPTGFVDPSGLEAGWGTRKANTLDEYIEYAHNQYRYNDQEWFANGVNQSVADVAYGFSDFLRVGNGVAQAYYCEDNIWGQAAFVMMDVSRASAIAAIFLGATAGRVGVSRPVRAPKAYETSRPSYGKGQVDEVWANAKNVDGKVYDPNTGVELQWDKAKPRNGQWDMGHTPTNEYWKLRKAYLEGKISKEEFIKRYRDPSNYRPEHPGSNRSRKYQN